jgi:hypothetical protein
MDAKAPPLATGLFPSAVWEIDDSGKKNAGTSVGAEESLVNE